MQWLVKNKETGEIVSRHYTKNQALLQCQQDTEIVNIFDSDITYAYCISAEGETAIDEINKLFAGLKDCLETMHRELIKDAKR